MFPRRRRSVRHALGHTRLLAPRDTGAYPPAVVLKGNRQPLRDEAEVFVLQPKRRCVTAWVITVVSGPVDPCARFSFASNATRKGFCWLVCSASLRGVAIPDVQPQRPIIPKHPPHTPKHLDHIRHKLLRRLLKAKLTLNPVVTQTPIRRTRHARLHSFTYLRQLLYDVTNQDHGCWPPPSRISCRASHVSLSI